MAFGCQEKTSPIDRKEERDIIRPKVNEALTNDPMVLACVFHRECQYAKTCLHQTSIEIDWIAKDVLWQSVCCHSTASEYISVPLSRRSQSKRLGSKIHPVRVSLGQGAERGYRLVKHHLFVKGKKDAANQSHELRGIWPTLFSSQAASSK